MSETRPWRTNIGLRLTASDGIWFEKMCSHQNRAMANYVELLIKHERERAGEPPSPNPEALK